MGLGLVLGQSLLCSELYPSHSALLHLLDSVLWPPLFVWNRKMTFRLWHFHAYAPPGPLYCPAIPTSEHPLSASVADPLKIPVSVPPPCSTGITGVWDSLQGPCSCFLLHLGSHRLYWNWIPECLELIGRQEENTLFFLLPGSGLSWVT